MSSLRARTASLKHLFEEMLDVRPGRRYRIEQVFVEHVFQEDLMSALAVPPPPRLHTASCAPVPRGVGAPDAAGEDVAGQAVVSPAVVSPAVAGRPARLRLLDGGEASTAESRRGHLRLVTSQVPAAHRDDEEVRRPGLPVESARRPAAVGRARHWTPRRRGVGERSVRDLGVEELAPLHPAVRAARARRERSAAAAAATTSPRTEATHRTAVSRQAVAPRQAVTLRQGAVSPEVPLVLRRLVAAGAALLAVVLLVADYEIGRASCRERV